MLVMEDPPHRMAFGRDWESARAEPVRDNLQAQG